jgi:hypothetical protein
MRVTAAFVRFGKQKIGLAPEVSLTSSSKGPQVYELRSAQPGLNANGDALESAVNANACREWCSCKE